MIVCNFGMWSLVVRSSDISEILENFSKNLPRVRSSNLVSLGESLLIDVLF